MTVTPIRDARGFPLSTVGMPIEARCGACGCPMVDRFGDEYFTHDCDCLHRKSDEGQTIASTTSDQAVTDSDLSELIRAYEGNGECSLFPSAVLSCLKELQSRRALKARLDDCEASLRAFDAQGSSEYWLRYPEPAPHKATAISQLSTEISSQPASLYLIRKNAAPTRPAHIWTGQDTVCRMASTGGLSIRKYTVIDQLNGRPICQNCINVGNQTGAVEQKR